MNSEDKRFKPSHSGVGSNPTADKEKPQRICGECAKFHKPECEWSGGDPAAILEADPACEEFQWAERSRILALGPFIIRVKKDLALIYKGDEPKYPVKIRDLSSQHTRKNLAKSLGVQPELVHPVAAKLLEMAMAEPEKAEAAEQPSASQAEAEERARMILETGDPIEFIADTVSKVHVGDREKAQLSWLAAVTPGLGYELNMIAVGSSGVGKSDLMDIVLCCVPDENVVRLKECSPKALYYAVKAGVELDGSVIYFDDVPDQPETVKLLKDITGENRASPRLWSVTADREFFDVELPTSFVVLASAVTNLTDPGGQITRRYMVLNPEEDPEANRAVMEHIKREMQLGRGKRYLPSDFEVAKELTRLIRAVEKKVVIPFNFHFPIYGTPARSDLKQFGALIWAVARARSKKRLSIGGYTLAEPGDFETARTLWLQRQELKVDETAEKVLEQLGNEEPQQDYDEKGRHFGWTPEPTTSTTIARALKEKPRLINEKLLSLYAVGYADRKAIGGRGNPYAYWKSPADLGVSESAGKSSSIELEKDENSLNDLGGEIRSSIRVEAAEFNRAWDEYLKRFREQVSILLPESPPKSLIPKTRPSEPIEPKAASKSQTPKSLGSFPEPSSLDAEPRADKAAVEGAEALRSEDVLRLERLEEPDSGECPLCKQRRRLEWCVTKHNGEWGLLCGECGWKLQNAMGKGD